MIAEAKTRTGQLQQFLTSAVRARSQNRDIQPPTGEKLQAVMDVVGRRKDHEAQLLPARSERGPVIGASAIARDITQRKRMAADLRQLSGRILNAQDEERRRIALRVFAAERCRSCNRG